MKVWITKYALTKGLFEINAELVSNAKYASQKDGGAYRIFTNEYTRTRAEAVKVAEEMRKRRIASLKKSIAKLEKMEF